MKKKEVLDEKFLTIQAEYTELYKWYKKEQKKFKAEQKLRLEKQKKNTQTPSKLKFERVIIERQEVL